MNSPHERERRLGSSLSLSVGRGGWGKECEDKEKEKFTDDEWMSVNLGDIERDEGKLDIMCGEEGMERAVEVIDSHLAHLVWVWRLMK